MKELGKVVSGPMLVLAVGNFAGTLLENLLSLFHQCDVRRSRIVGFYRVISGGMAAEDGRVSLETIPESMETVTGTMQVQVSSSLDAVLHDLRLHEKFLEVGMGDEQDLPLGVVVLADLTEPGCESLHPLIIELRQQIAKEPGSYIYLLCKTAVFEGNPAKKLVQARRYLHLKYLNELTGQGGGRIQTYLFDRFKEGLLEAKDEGEIGVLMQNFLLALLSGRLAQKVAQTYALADQGGALAHYNSAGTTALVYDPVTLQEECARRLAVETLEIEFLPGVIPDPAQIETKVNRILESIGAVAAWTEDLCSDTPFHAIPAGEIKLYLHFSDLQFEGLPPQEWGDAIAGYAGYFETELEPVYLETLEKNVDLLEQAIQVTLEAELKDLPLQSSLYPGGIANALHVVEGCIQRLSRKMQSYQRANTEEETLRQLEREYSSSMDRLDRLIEELPEPPCWMKRLPGKLYGYAKMLFEFLLLRREHAYLLALREKIVQALEVKFIFLFEQRVRKVIVELCSQIIVSFEKSRSELNSLRAELQHLKKHLQGEPPGTLPVSSPFRMHLITPALLQWAYARRGKEMSEIRTELLEAGLMDDWSSLSEGFLREELVSMCRSAYRFLNDFNLEQILKDPESTNLPSSPVPSTGLLRLLAQAAVPALRPDFDTTGESLSYMTHYFLCADPRQSDIPGILKGAVHEWQGVATGDPCTILFCRVRHMIPVDTLAFLLHASQAGFDSLSKQEQKELQQALEGKCP